MISLANNKNPENMWDWYVTPQRVVLAGLYQGTLIGTPNADWCCTRVADWYLTPPRVVLVGLYQGKLIGTPNADWYCTRVHRLVRDTSGGRFGRAVPGYADWYTERWLELYQGTPIGTWRLLGYFWQGCTRVRWLIHRTLIGMVPGYPTFSLDSCYLIRISLRLLVLEILWYIITVYWSGNFSNDQRHYDHRSIFHIT